MTLEEFKLVDPGSDFIYLLYDSGSNTTVTAVNIATVDCNNENITSVLSELTELTINVNSIPYNLAVTYSQPFSGYYHFKVEDKEILGIDTVDETSCSIIYTNPSYESSGFLKSEYQATLNNTNSNRTTSFIFEVDRTRLQISASNIDLINNQTATVANVQEYNYSSVGIINSRYNGTKTSTQEYGISPAFTGTLVEASTYVPGQTNGYICSQSLNDRIIEDIIVGYDAATSPSFDGSIQYADDISINYSYLAKFYFTSGSHITSTATTLTLNAYVDVYEDDIIRLEQGTNLREVMKVTSVTSKSASQTIFSVTRAYKSDVDPNNNAITFYKNGILGVSRLTGTQLFKADGNKLYKLSNKKVWIKENSKIFYVDERGQVIFELITCSI